MVQFIIFPFIEKRDRLKRNVQVKTKMLKDMLYLRSEYDVIREKSELIKAQFAARAKDFTLFSFLDKLSGEVEVKDRISYMKPSTSVKKNSPYKILMVEMKFQDITIEQLSKYLYMIETSNNMVKIKRLSISKKGRQDQGLNAVIQVETIESISL